jgi:hypothetical protein
MKQPLKSPTNLLAVSYTILFLILGATLVAYIYGSYVGPDWLRDGSLNVGTEVFGILLTVFLIDAVIRRKEERERNRVRQIAFQQLRIPLLHQLIILHGMYKASVLHPPEKRPTEVKELFDDNYFVEIAFLDLSKVAPARNRNIAGLLQWMDYLKQESDKFKSALGRTIDKYAVFLDARTVELSEKMINSHFLWYIEGVTIVRDVEVKEKRKRTYLLSDSGADFAREYTSYFSEFVEIYNAVVPADQKITVHADLWNGPFGSARASWAASSTAT